VQQSGYWLDRTTAFVAGSLGTFIGLTILWGRIVRAAQRDSQSDRANLK
jgi:hypothetical protein